MPVVTDIQTISNTIGDLLNFVRTNEKVKEDFEDYLKTINASHLSENKLQALCIPYITERIIFKENNKTIPELYLEEVSDISDLEKEIILGLNNTISSIFEVKKVLRNGFVMYNYVNEKTYTIIPLVKMTNLRDVLTGQFALVRIFKFQNDYFMLEISDVIPSYEKEKVLNFAVAKIIEKPEDLYFDNEEKFSEIKSYVKNSVKCFKDFFKTDEIVTTNKKIDTLVDMLNNYQETGIMPETDDINSNIESVENHRYFKVQEFENSYGTFIKKSVEGFSSHSKIYDVGYLTDEQLGVFIIPFWATLCKIFENDSYTEIENYQNCVKDFITNDKIPPSFIFKLASKSKNDFEKRLKDIMQEDLSVEEFIQKYKGDYLKKTIFSSSNALYCSKTFAKVIELQDK